MDYPAYAGGDESGGVKAGGAVNLEFDMLAKYVERILRGGEGAGVMGGRPKGARVRSGRILPDYPRYCASMGGDAFPRVLMFRMTGQPPDSWHRSGLRRKTGVGHVREEIASPAGAIS